MTELQAKELNNGATAQPKKEDLINPSPFSEMELTDSPTFEIVRENGYNKAITDCFNMIMDENMAEPLKIRLIGKIHDLAKK